MIRSLQNTYTGNDFRQMEGHKLHTAPALHAPPLYGQTSFGTGLGPSKLAGDSLKILQKQNLVTRTQSYDKPIPILINRKKQALRRRKEIEEDLDKRMGIGPDGDKGAQISPSSPYSNNERASRIERSVTISVCSVNPTAPTIDDLYHKPYAPLRTKKAGDRRRTITVE